MKKITTILCAILIASGLLQAQTTYTIGPSGRDYATIVDAWNAVRDINNTATEFIFNIDAGTYTEAQPTLGLGGKTGIKITFRGAGADKTIIQRSASTTFNITTTTENPGRFLWMAAVDLNMELTFENMTFQTMGFTNTNGGVVVNSAGPGQKVTFRNCNFKNIYARTGAILQATGSVNTADGTTASFTIENCFFENCGAKDNSDMKGMFFISGGDFNISNCSFVNNDFSLMPGATDANRRNGMIFHFTSIASATINNVNIVNTIINNGDLVTIKPIICVKPGAGIVPAITMSNVISVGNTRASSLDCDLFYDLTVTPTASDFFANAVKSFDNTAVPTLDADVTTMTGATINATATAADYFEMDGTAPMVVTNSLGVKSLVRKTAGINEMTISGLKAWSVDGVLRVNLETPKDVSIFNATGMLVSNFKNTLSIQTTLSKGMYILKVNENSMKVIVK